MKLKLITVWIVAMSCVVPTHAQSCEDAFVAGFGFSTRATGDGERREGIATYKGGFRKYEVYGAYEKFLWKGLFLMPELSLWYSDNYDDDLYKYSYDPSVDLNPDLKRGKLSSWQIGGTVSALGAWRQQLFHNFCVDFLTGPRLTINFKGKVKGYGYEFDDFYRTLMFEWRFGVGINILRHWRVGVNFDLRTGRHKDISTGVNGMGWLPGDRILHNSWNFSVGYRF